MVPNNANTYLPGTIAIPSALAITAITQDYPAIISVSVDPVTESNSYEMGQLIKLTIPFEYGMQQANSRTVQILAVLGSSITVDLDTRNFDPFSVPIPDLQIASLAPSGSRNIQYNNNTLLVPFQSLNDMGN